MRLNLCFLAKRGANNLPYMRMKHTVDPAKHILDELGDLSDIGVYRNLVLVAIYVRPSQTASGIHLADRTKEEDKHQGKVGLIVKAGPQAFVDPENKWFDGNPPKVGDWVWSMAFSSEAAAIPTRCETL